MSKGKGKENKEAQDVSKNYSDYTYLGDEVITMSVPEFVAIQKALDQAIQNGVVAQHPKVVRWFDSKSGKPVENPTKKQIDNKEVRLLADSELTKSEQNLQINYNANLFPTVFNGREILMGIHERMVDEGVAKPVADVKKAYEERKAKGQMKIQEDDEPVSAPKQNPEAGNAPMRVVRDEPKEESGEEGKQ